MMMKVVLWSGVVAACGGSQQASRAAPTDAVAPGADRDTRTPFERRLAAACDALGPRLTQCAVDDSQALVSAGKISAKEHADLTTPQVRAALDADWEKKCNRADRSSRQVRVLEVCHSSETACEPLLGCLENLSAPANR